MNNSNHEILFSVPWFTGNKRKAEILAPNFPDPLDKPVRHPFKVE
jgi:hypothetical protein